LESGKADSAARVDHASWNAGKSGAENLRQIGARINRQGKNKTLELAQPDAGVRQGNLNTMFEYVFDHHMAATKVKIHMKKAIADDSFWIFVKRL